MHRVNQEEMLSSVHEKRASLEEISVANRTMDIVCVCVVCWRGGVRGRWCVGGEGLGGGGVLEGRG